MPVTCLGFYIRLCFILLKYILVRLYYLFWITQSGLGEFVIVLLMQIYLMFVIHGPIVSAGKFGEEISIKISF